MLCVVCCVLSVERCVLCTERCPRCPTIEVWILDDTVFGCGLW